MNTSVGELRNFSAALIVIAEAAPDRMAISQAIFFLTAAAEELSGKQPTFTDVRSRLGDDINRTLHATYKVILEPSHKYPKALGWMTREQNPSDNREWFLKLTPKGRAVIDRVLEALSISPTCRQRNRSSC